MIGGKNLGVGIHLVLEERFQLVLEMEFLLEVGFQLVLEVGFLLEVGGSEDGVSAGVGGWVSVGGGRSAGAGDGVSAGVGGGDSESDGDGDVRDTEFLVAEAMRRLPPAMEVSLELRPCDIDEDRVVEEFMRRGCSCTKWGGKACSQQFTTEHVKATRLSMKELTTSQLDLVLMGQLMATTNTCDTTITDKKHHQSHQRKRDYTTGHWHQGKQICVEVFKFLHGIGEKRLRNVSRAMQTGGIAPRVHGNTRRLPKNTLSVSSSSGS